MGRLCTWESNYLGNLKLGPLEKLMYGTITLKILLSPCPHLNLCPLYINTILSTDQIPV